MCDQVIKSHKANKISFWQVSSFAVGDCRMQCEEGEKKRKGKSKKRNCGLFNSRQ
jgi:hypothetical protein